MNKRWFDKLPADLQKILITVIEEESAKTRELTRKQQDTQVAKAKEAGVAFYKLSDAEKQQLVDMIAPVYESWGEKIGMDYFKKVQSTLGN
jgi:TRAP-type C4-dicarboxylate transport system substrate-binding protein